MTRMIDLNHVIEDGLVTYPGLPAAHICDFWTRKFSADHYEDGSTFHIGRIDMVSNTGTYIDAPFHRFENGTDIAGLQLDGIADLPGVCIDSRRQGRGIGAASIEGIDVHGKAVLFMTGWDRHWGSDAYFEANPHLKIDTAAALIAGGASLVGIDSLNIDDTVSRRRPIHTALLEAGIPIVEHLCGLDALPHSGFRFSAVPPRVSGMGTFPVRAFATMD